METQLRELVALGLGLLLLLLRFDAERFGAAEYDEPTPLWTPPGAPGRRVGGDDAPLIEIARNPAFRRRAAWYLIGIGLIAAVYVVYPRPHDVLHLTTGDRGAAILGGLAIGSLGAGQALAFAWLRYGRFRLPPMGSYAGAIVNAVGTAIIDEATFRGIVLGFLLLTGVDPLGANLIQAMVYALATRLAIAGRSRYMLILVLAIGLLGGWLTLVTGGIGAAVIAHVITRIGLFVATGHAGSVGLPGSDVEDDVRVRRPPLGWRMLDLGRDHSEPASGMDGVPAADVEQTGAPRPR